MEAEPAADNLGTHGDRLSAIDASFLAQEADNTHMHLGAVAVFEGPPLSYGDLVAHIRSRLHMVPRYRQKLAFPPMETGRPLWIDDAAFDLGYHVRHAALPAPGTDEQLATLTARLHSEPLDRGRPLWEVWLVEGLSGDRCALVSKAHHALVDGLAGVGIVTVLFDLTDNAPPALEQPVPWAPRPAPGRAELALRGVRGAARVPFKLAQRALDAARSPTDAAATALAAVEGLGEVAWATLNPAPPTPLNVEIGRHRRVAFVRCPLEDLRRVRRAFGGTVNDVLLAVVAGALRRLLEHRGVSTDGLELRALVPVSVRTADESDAMGNRLVALRAALPLYLADPVARLRVIKESMDGVKRSRQAMGAGVLAQLEHFAPPALLGRATRLNFSTRLFNLLVTNVPGPQFPLFLLGRRLQHLFPVAFLARDHGLAVAIMSYDGAVDFGLLGDYDAMPDLETLGEGILESLQELLAAADEATGARAPAESPVGAPASQ